MIIINLIILYFNFLIKKYEILTKNWQHSIHSENQPIYKH